MMTENVLISSIYQKKNQLVIKITPSTIEFCITKTYYFQRYQSPLS